MIFLTPVVLCGFGSKNKKILLQKCKFKIQVDDSLKFMAQMQGQRHMVSHHISPSQIFVNFMHLILGPHSVSGKLKELEPYNIVCPKTTRQFFHIDLDPSLWIRDSFFVLFWIDTIEFSFLTQVSVA